MWIETDGFGSAENDTVRIGPCRNRTHFPAGTTARIFRRGRSAMSSGTADTRCWRMTFRGRGQRFIDPIMGWTGTDDPLAGLELQFPTLEAAIRYAHRQGFDFAADGNLYPVALSAGALDEKSPPAVVQKRAA